MNLSQLRPGFRRSEGKCSEVSKEVSKVKAS